MNADYINRQRRSGVLLHPSSFPGELEQGDIGHQAYRFIEFLSAHGFKVWQMLPLGPTHHDGSPYQCLSSHAGNPMLISLDWLADKGWLDMGNIKCEIKDRNYRIACLRQAGQQFFSADEPVWMERFDVFRKDNAYWLDDYVLFMALKNKHQQRPWYEWPMEDRNRLPERMETQRQELANDIEQFAFEQFIFFSQWFEIRDYAKYHGIELFGDLPIFVAADSADVWANKNNFLLNDEGNMEYVAGVPPDAFSDTGQRWGNPLYDWDYMEKDGFRWWIDRFRTQLTLFDLLRIDHFRGLQACWYIPADEDTAINGKWVEVPGQSMLSAVFSAFERLPVVAEDLGVITDEVVELKNRFNMPGMKVLQFAFDGNNANPHLPHCHLPGDIIYTGTHDNDTSLGWAQHESNYNRMFFDAYTADTGKGEQDIALTLVRLAMSSVSFLSIIPMQDLLMLDSSARMNIPGTLGDNWKWRFDWQQLKPEILETISNYMKLYQR